MNTNNNIQNVEDEIFKLIKQKHNEEDNEKKTIEQLKKDLDELKIKIQEMRNNIQTLNDIILVINDIIQNIFFNIEQNNEREHHDKNIIAIIIKTLKEKANNMIKYINKT